MLLRSLRLKDFRAHAHTELGLGAKINLFYGPNGAGKTNILEAVHYLCLSKSFLASNDAHAVRRGTDHFEVAGRFEGQRRPEMAARIVYAPQSGKRIFVNGAPLERLADIVGQLPVVILAPEDYVLTAGGPEERRRFLDNTLSQARPAYLHDLLRYRRALKQRNAALSHQRRSGQVDAAALEAWAEELVILGARIIWRRHCFVEEFGIFLDRAYAQIESVAEQPSITYDTAVQTERIESQEAVADAFRGRLERLTRAERERGRTLAGPHRDELVFRIGDLELRPYASQGQHRTFALALRLATFFFLHDHLEEVPLLLLDDVFGTLDEDRARVVLELLESDAVGQSLLTAARLDPFGEHILSRPEHNTFPVVNGHVGAASTV